MTLIFESLANFKIVLWEVYSDFLEEIEDWVMCVYIMHLGDQRESLTLSYKKTKANMTLEIRNSINGMTCSEIEY